jgi:hypothetical protein
MQVGIAARGIGFLMFPFFHDLNPMFWGLDFRAACIFTLEGNFLGNLLGFLQRLQGLCGKFGTVVCVLPQSCIWRQS